MALKKKKQELTASKVSNLVSDTNENLLRVNLSKFFTDLEADIQKALIEYWNDNLLLQGQINLILAPIHEKHHEYFDLLMSHKLQEFRRAVKLGERLVKREQRKVAMKSAQPVQFTHNRDNLFGTLEYTEDRLSEYTFTASESTLNRVDKNINQILVDGYRGGNGIDEVSRRITERFDQLRTWEATRIARTEIHNSQNLGIMSSYESMGVEYTQWVAAHDSRTRRSHLDIDGEIIRFGGVYSNKLKFPGDTGGPIKEWVNCRCSNAPFVLPPGMMAPSFSPFRESDLIPIGSGRVQEPTRVNTIKEPTAKQLKANLTKAELKQVEWAKDVQTSEHISERGKAKARQQLEELYAKALKKPIPKTEKVPPQTVEAKPLQSKAKTVEKQPVQPKVSEDDKINRMTSNELYESMTKADKKKYDKFKKKVETADRNIKQLGENPILLDMKKKNLMELRKLEQKQRTKLENKGKKKPKQKPVRTNERTLDNIHKEIEVPTDELIPQLEKWIDKRCKNTAEFGYHFDVKTGKLIGEEIRGKKGRITISDTDKQTGSIHSHPRNGMSAPSIEDLETFRCKREQHHFMVSEHEIWYVKATDNFGIGGMGQQLDLQSAHKACRDRAFETVSKLVKKGKIEATEEALAKALDKYTGDEILKTFNKPPWNKTMTVKRYYR